VITAIAGLVTAVAGLIAVWQRIHPGPVPGPVTPTTIADGRTPTIATITISPTATAVDPRGAAETLALRFEVALIRGGVGNVGFLSDNSSTPFFVSGRDPIRTQEELRRLFDQVGSKGTEEEVERDLARTQGAEAKTFKEWRAEGYDLSLVRAAIDLGDDDYMVRLITTGKPLAFLMRRSGKTLTVAGVEARPIPKSNTEQRDHPRD
jgi:hypothetical protein